MSSVVSHDIPHPRTKTLMTDAVLHKAASEEEAKVAKELLALRHRENPIVLVKPVPNAKGKISASDREKYTVLLQQYNKYKSPDYDKAKRRFTLWVKLNEVKDLLTPKPNGEKELTEGKRKAIRAIEQEIKSPVSKVNQYSGKNKERLEQAQEARNTMRSQVGQIFREKLGSPDLFNLAAVDAAIAALVEHPNVPLFIRAHKLRGDKYKVSPTASISLAKWMDDVANTLVRDTIRRVKASLSGVIVKPEHVLAAVQQHPWAFLLKDLPIVALLAARESRKREYDEVYNEAKREYEHDKREFLKRQKTRAEGQREEYKPFEHATFGEAEVIRGYAISRAAEKTAKTKDGAKPRVTYLWKDLDIPNPQFEGLPDYSSYISAKFAKRLHTERLTQTIRVKGTTKRVINSIIVQAAMRVTVAIKHIVDNTKGVLIKGEDVVTALQIASVFASASGEQERALTLSDMTQGTTDYRKTHSTRKADQPEEKQPEEKQPEAAAPVARAVDDM